MILQIGARYFPTSEKCTSRIDNDKSTKLLIVQEMLKVVLLRWCHAKERTITIRTLGISALAVTHDINGTSIAHIWSIIENIHGMVLSDRSIRRLDQIETRFAGMMRRPATPSFWKGDTFTHLRYPYELVRYGISTEHPTPPYFTVDGLHVGWSRLVSVVCSGISTKSMSY